MPKFLHFVFSCCFTDPRDVGHCPGLLSLEVLSCPGRTSFLPVCLPGYV